jgi:hypothetical protein
VVLPEQSTPEEIQRVMQGFTTALGVDCAYCHAQPPAPAGRGGRGRGAVAFDFASDEKPPKTIARTMMRMVRDINATVSTAISRPADAAAAVGCITCHRGVPVPLQLADVLDRAARDRGQAEAMAVYRDLRRRYFGAQAYDFSESSLIGHAERLVRAGQHDDAIAWLESNLKYFPRSASTYAALSTAQQQKRDTAAAIASLERAVALSPDNQQFRRQLDDLRGLAPAK